MSSSTLPSPTDDGQKFYDELLNKYQLYRTKNNLNVNIESDLNNESNVDVIDSQPTKNDNSNDQNKYQNKESNVFIVEPDDQLLNEFFDENDLSLNEKLIKLKDRLQDEINKEIKIKDSTDTLRKVSNDPNILLNLNCILKQSNYRLNELKRDLQELNSYIQINSGQSSPKTQKKDSFDSYSDKEEENKNNNNNKLHMLNIDKIKGDNISIASIESASSPNTRVLALEKQLTIEYKVLEGAKNMLSMYSKNRNKKFMKEAKTMIEYSQAKIDYIKMMIDKIQEHDKRVKKSNTDEKSSINLNLLKFDSLCLNQPKTPEIIQEGQQQTDAFKNRYLQFQSKSSSCIPNNTTDLAIDEELSKLIEQEKLFNLRIEELKARLKLELTVMDGLKNIILTLQADKTDKNTIQDAKSKLIESYQKVYLLRFALKSILDKLDSKSIKYESIDSNLKISKNASTDLKAKSIYTSLPTDFNSQHVDLNELSKQSQFSLPKCLAVCGKLEIKLIGVKNLLTKIERFDSDRSISSSSSKKKNYKISDSVSNEVKAVLKLDNIIVAETTFQRISDRCFNCLGFFSIELDRHRELEIQFYYNDHREFCAFKHLYLEDFVDNENTKHQLDLEPCGSLELELRILNPMITKNNRIQRRKLLRFKSETFLRPNQMNTNVATWARLMKKNIFDNQPKQQFSSAKSFASFTSNKKIDDCNSSSGSSSSDSSSNASMCQLKLNKTIDSLKEEEDECEDSENELDQDEKPRIKDDKLEFIKKLKEQNSSDQINEFEIASLSTSEEEIDLIDMTITVEEDDNKSNKTKNLYKSKTENLRSKATMRQVKKEHQSDYPNKQTTKIESIDSSDSESSNDLNERESVDDKKLDLIELDDDDDQVDNFPLNKFNLMNREEKRDRISDQSKEIKWETKDIKLSDFSFITTLGRGYFGKVIFSLHKKTNTYYAIKALKKKDIIARYEVDTLLSEKNVFLLANRHKHPFLVQLFACIQTEHHVCFVMDFCSGGDLMHWINQEIFDDEQAVFYASSIVLCLEFLHKNKVIFRDLKLDNILLDKEGYIKLTDYGLCKEGIGYGDTTSTFCGTPDQIAPEVLTENNYTNSVDWWALGVLIYQMLTGHSPFLGDDQEEIFDSIVNDEVIFPKYISFESTVLIRRLLRKDPKKRLGASPRDAEDVKKHSFFKEIDFEALYNRELTPPFVPQIVNHEDVSNFEFEFTSRDPNLSFSNINRKLTEKDQKLFGSFDYISDEWKEIMDRNQNENVNQNSSPDKIDKESDDQNRDDTGSDQTENDQIKENEDQNNSKNERSSDNLSNQSLLDERHSTGENDNKERYSSIQEFEIEGKENEEILIDLIERKDE